MVIPVLFTKVKKKLNNRLLHWSVVVFIIKKAHIMPGLFVNTQGNFYGALHEEIKQLCSSLVCLGRLLYVATEKKILRQRKGQCVGTEEKISSREMKYKNCNYV